MEVHGLDVMLIIKSMVDLMTSLESLAVMILVMTAVLILIVMISDFVMTLMLVVLSLIHI